MSEQEVPILILMADDDPDDRLLAEKALRLYRLRNGIRFVENGDELMDYLHHRGKYADPASSPEPGIILLDLNMPRKDGREALAEIKGDPVLRRVPVVILTTSKSEEDILRSYDLGVNSYITKPVTFQALAEVMKVLSVYWFEIVKLPNGLKALDMSPASLRILLIDDDEDALVIVRGLLSRTDMAFDLEWAPTTALGLEALRRGPHDAALLDYRLGKDNGLDLLRQAVAENCRVPLIMLTSQDDHEIDLQAMKAGAADYLVKDALVPVRLERSIRYAVERQAMLDSLATRAEELRQSAMQLERYRQEQLEALNRAVRDRLAELEAILDIAPAGIVIAHDRECRRITGNQSARDLLQALRSGGGTLVADGERPRGTAICRGGKEVPREELPLQSAATQGVAVRDFECDLILEEGRTCHLVGNAVPLFDEGGQVRGAVASFLDITPIQEAAEERRKLEAKIQQTQKLESLGVLAGGIAHDFNNLLTGVLGHADLALREVSATDVRHHVEQVVVGARQAADLTRQMLAYSGKGRLIVQALQLNDLIKELAPLLQVSISKRCLLRCCPGPNLPLIDGDMVELRQVLMNLIINASEAMEELGGFITLVTGTIACDRRCLAESCVVDNLPEGPYVFLEVSDTGCGMSTETRERIFDPFFSTKAVGRGLGLAAVLGIVRGHRGALKVCSQLGAGATFTVLFPAVQRPVLNQGTRPPGKHDYQFEGTVLVIDDEKWVRELAGSMLQKMGVKVLLAADGREGTQLCRDHARELSAVLLDWTMPHMSGEETFQALRAIRGDIPVVLSSGHSEEAAVNRFGGMGLAGFLQKPYRFEELADALLKAIPAAGL